jgi:hypothetical protein
MHKTRIRNYSFLNLPVKAFVFLQVLMERAVASRQSADSSIRAFNLHHGTCFMIFLPFATGTESVFRKPADASSGLLAAVMDKKFTGNDLSAA